MRIRLTFQLFVQLQSIFTLINHVPQYWIFILDKIPSRAELNNLARIQHHDTISIDDRIQSMGNGEYGPVGELTGNRILDQGISCGVNICSSLVN